MKTKLLPSRAQRWDELKQEHTFESAIYYAYDKFDNFLKQEPELYMFVPCDKDNVPLEKPQYFNSNFNLSNWLTNEDKILNKQYQQALDRVIFDGFEIFGTENFYRLELSNGFTIVYDKRIGKFLKYKTLADLSGKVNVNINGQKQSGI